MNLQIFWGISYYFDLDAVICGMYKVIYGQRTLSDVYLLQISK